MTRTHPRVRGGYAARYASLVFGLFLFALAIVLILESKLGLSPWDVLNQGLAKHTPLSFGMANVAVALAVLLAGTLRAEGVLALANLIWVTLLGLGGVIIPRTQMPSGLSHVAALLPSGALGDGLREAFMHGRLAGIPLLVLVVWGAVATSLASRTFRWSD